MLRNQLFQKTMLIITVPVIIIVNNAFSLQSINKQKTKIKKPIIVEHKKGSEIKRTNASCKTLSPKLQKKEQQKTYKTITVKNDITTDMLTYKHWTGTHEPNFTLTVNGKKIAQGEKEKITIKDDNLDVRYDYSFANGFRKGASVVSCQLDQGAKKVDITFSWEDKWRIKSQQAQPQKEEKRAFSA